MIKTIKPLGDRVVVKYDKAGEATSKGGIILPDTASRGTTVFGEVIKVGPGIYSITGVPIPMTVKTGDVVMFKKDMVSDPIVIDGEDYLLFREQDLLMVI